MISDDNKLSDESTEVVANLKSTLKELDLTVFELEIAIKILKLAEIEELSDRISKPLDVNATLSSLNKN